VPARPGPSCARPPPLCPLRCESAAACVDAMRAVCVGPAPCHAISIFRFRSLSIFFFESSLLLNLFYLSFFDFFSFFIDTVQHRRSQHVRTLTLMNTHTRTQILLLAPPKD
jgi:hypothetical protein